MKLIKEMEMIRVKVWEWISMHLGMSKKFIHAGICG